MERMRDVEMLPISEIVVLFKFTEQSIRPVALSFMGPGPGDTTTVLFDGAGCSPCVRVVVRLSTFPLILRWAE